MEDLAFYNQGYKALSLLITIFANVVIYRLLTRDALGIGSTHTQTHTHTHNTHARHGRLRVVRSARQRCGVALLMQITRRLCAVCYAASEDVSAVGSHLNRMSLILPAAMLVQYRCRKY